MRLFRSHYQMIFIVQTLDRLQGWEIRTQGILYMSCRIKKKGLFMFPALKDPWWGENCEPPPVTEASAVPPWGDMLGGQLPSPCQPPCKGKMCGLWIFMGCGVWLPNPRTALKWRGTACPCATGCRGSTFGSSPDISMCKQEGKHFLSSAWYFPGFVMPRIGHEILISCHSTQSCVHSHAASAGNTWASLWHQENFY